MGAIEYGPNFFQEFNDLKRRLEILERVGGGGFSRIANTYASTTARDAAIPNPIVAQSAYVTSTGTLYVWNGSAWKTIAIT